MTRILLYQLRHYREVLTFFLQGNNEEFSVRVLNTSDVEKQILLDQSDIILLDISADFGHEVFCKIKKYYTAIKIIILTNNSSMETVMQYLRSGADGYLLIRKTGLTKLPDYINDTLEGGIPISPTLMSTVMKELSLNHTSGLDSETLTRREAEILKLLVNGMSYKGISFALNIAIDTVRSHIKHIYAKLKVNSKSEAVVKAIRSNIMLA